MGLEQSRINMRRERAQSTNSMPSEALYKKTVSPPPPPRVVQTRKMSHNTPDTFEDACRMLGITSASDDSFLNSDNESEDTKKVILSQLSIRRAI